MTAVIGILMGSDSDYSYAKKSMEVLQSIGIPFEISVISAHRDTERALEYAQTAQKRGIKVILAFAGMAAHLAGVIAANTILPVIGIPLNRTGFGGQDALLSTVQMPPGIPVATVGVDASENAAWLAIRILALQDSALALRLLQIKESMKYKLTVKTEEVRKMWENESSGSCAN